MRKRSDNGGFTIQNLVFKFLRKKGGAQCREVSEGLGVGRKAVEDAVRAMLGRGLVSRHECKISTTWARKGKPYAVTYNAVKYMAVQGKRPPRDMRGQMPGSKEAIWLEHGRTKRNKPRRPVATYVTALEQCWGIRPDSRSCAENTAGRELGTRVASRVCEEEPA